MPSTRMLRCVRVLAGSLWVLWISATPSFALSPPLLDSAARVWQQVATAPDPAEHQGTKLSIKASNLDRLKGLVGTYYVNGLASCRIGKRLIHPFESHGFLKRVELDFDQSPPTASLTAKYVQTPVRKYESWLQRPLFRGAMSAVAPMQKSNGLSMIQLFLSQLLNALSPTTRETANLAVRMWPSRPSSNSTSTLIASSDNCRFYLVDATTLETHGPEPVGSSSPMLAHTRVDNRRDRLVTCSLQYRVNGEANTLLTFEEIDSNGNSVGTASFTIQPPIVVHDWSLTEHYYVIPAAEIEFDLNKLPNLLLGQITATELFSVNPHAPAAVYLLQRPGCSDSTTPIRATMDRHGVVFHVGP
jgi:carotenoid cleavage dioxygenase-like enzyme